MAELNGKRLAATGLLASSLLLAVCPAVADPKPPAASQDPKQRARQLFDEALAALKEGRFAEARDLLERSMLAAPNPGTAFNLGVALRGTGQPVDAVRVFDALLAGEYGKLSRAQRKEVGELRKQTAADIARLEVTVRGAKQVRLVVNGDEPKLARGGKKQLLELNPGEHRLRFSAKGRRPETRTLKLTRGTNPQLLVQLELAPATLEVYSGDPKTFVEIVGHGRAQGELSRELPPGKYELRARSANGEEQRWISIGAGASRRVRVDVPQSDSLFGQPLFWVGTAVVVTGAVVGVFLLTRDNTEDPVKDPEFGVTQTLQRGIRF